MQNYNNAQTKESLLTIVPIENKPYCYQVELDLPMQRRYIGKIDTGGDGDTFFTKRKQKHIFKKTNSLGLNYALLNSPYIKYKWIVIDFEGRKLVTSRAYFNTYGKQFQFSQKDFELQVFLPIDEFGIDKARAFEKAKVIQQDLFGRKAV